jgi:hypothetical protein
VRIIRTIKHFGCAWIIRVTYQVTKKEDLENKGMDRYDIIVYGGGTAGMIAAVSSARAGARILLIEREGYLGGTATYGVPFLGFFSGDGKKVVGGLPQELVDRMISGGGSVGHVRGGTWKLGTGEYDYEFSLVPYDPECLKFTAQEMALEAGAELMLRVSLTGVEVDGKKICAVEVMTVEGRQRLDADLFVDATGDAMLTSMAGFPTELQGRGKMQNVTILFRMGNVDVDRMLDALMSEQRIKGFKDWHVRIIRGKLLDEGEGIVILAGHMELWEDKPPLTFFAHRWRKEEICLNITRTTDIDPTKQEDINWAEISERRNVHAAVTALKERIPGFENAHLVVTAPHVGLREGRRIKGLFTLTEEHVIEGEEFPDGIARGAYPMDIHDPKGGKTQFTFIKEGGSYSIPYRCLIPNGSENLLVAGRCISTTGKALGSARMTACCMALGQAAGTAAALASGGGVSPAKLDTKLLREKLLSDGAILDV